ncbi:MAG: hypothetical protein ABIH90_02740 [Candidatus Aenigmatarchaeota archaeon]
MLESFIWFGSFIAIAIGFLLILWKDQRRFYSFCFVFAAILGFYFDYLNTRWGYYSYAEFYPIMIGGVPLSMTIAEGMAVAITIWLFKYFLEMFKKKDCFKSISL